MSNQTRTIYHREGKKHKQSADIDMGYLDLFITSRSEMRRTSITTPTPYEAELKNTSSVAVRARGASWRVGNMILKEAWMIVVVMTEPVMTKTRPIRTPKRRTKTI